MLVTILFVLGVSLPSAAEAKQMRSPAAKAEFKRQNPCPGNGQKRGSCPDWIIDHVVPICAGGLDLPSNMQWQTTADAKSKDHEERRLCRANRR